MANYIITYDLNSPTPAHAQMDKHLRASGASEVGRILETVWFITTSSDLDAVFKYANLKLSRNDRLLVVEASNMMMRNLLVRKETIQEAWDVTT